MPIWVAASAKASVKKLLGFPFETHEKIFVPNSSEKLRVKVHSSGFINNNMQALGITFVDSGLNLDMTNNLEIWTVVSFIDNYDKENADGANLINLIAGYGVGRFAETSEICISKFAQDILKNNLQDMIPSNKRLNLEIIFPRGEFLSERTSNKSFGIVKGLSIIGTNTNAYESASPQQLKDVQLKIDEIVSNGHEGFITFVLGENGLDLAKAKDIQSPILKIGNWIGPSLVYAAAKNITKILLFGYHGKLIKLAGGIFHTHHHIADARMEILVYLAFELRLSTRIISKIIECETVEMALAILEDYDRNVVKKLWKYIANKIEIRALAYLNRYEEKEIKVGVILFDRKRRIRWFGDNAKAMLPEINTFNF